MPGFALGRAPAVIMTRQDPARPVLTWVFRGLFLTGLGVILIGALGLQETGGASPPGLAGDKAAHAGAFYGLTLTALLAFPRRAAWLTGALVFLISGLIELAQPAFGRQASVFDLAANAAGISLALLPVWVSALRARPRRRVLSL